MRLAYTENEIILCTYIALYGKGLLIEKKIAKYGHRPEDAVKRKIKNIAAILHEKGIPRCRNIIPATGIFNRKTDWAIIKSLVVIEKKQLLRKCKKILTTQPVSSSLS